MCVSELITIESDSGSSLFRHQAIIWINSDILSSELILPYCQLNLKEHVSMKYHLKYKSIHPKWIWIRRLQYDQRIVVVLSI